MTRPGIEFRLIGWRIPMPDGRAWGALIALSGARVVLAHAGYPWTVETRFEP